MYKFLGLLSFVLQAFLVAGCEKCTTCNNCAGQPTGKCELWVSEYGWCGEDADHKLNGTDCKNCTPGSNPGPTPTTVSQLTPCVGVDADDTLPPQITYDCPISNTPMVLYAGGGDWDQSFRWDHERDAHVDILMLAFVTSWTATCSEAPADLGSIGVPKLHTNGCPTGSAKPAKCGSVHTGNCADDGIAAQFLNAQKSGRRIILSVGGATGDANNMSVQKGRDLAHALWEMFLGGNAPAWRGMRPLGKKVVLDGIDLDLEQTPQDCPWSRGAIGNSCRKAMEGWAEFVKVMYDYMQADTRKRYLLTAVPINSKQTISYPGYGSHIQGFLDVETCDDVWLSDDPVAIQAVLDTMSEGYLKYTGMLDFIWAQFYPSPAEITMNSNCWEADLMAWAYICENGGGACRAGVGLPMGPSAASGGQIDAVAYVNKIKDAVQRRPLLQRRFGGTMGWEERLDWFTYGAVGQPMYSAVVVDRMNADVIPLLQGAPPSAVPSPTPGPQPSAVPSPTPGPQPSVDPSPTPPPSQPSTQPSPTPQPQPSANPGPSSGGCSSTPGWNGPPGSGLEGHTCKLMELTGYCKNGKAADGQQHIMTPGYGNPQDHCCECGGGSTPLPSQPTEKPSPTPGPQPSADPSPSPQPSTSRPGPTPSSKPSQPPVQRPTQPVDSSDDSPEDVCSGRKRRACMSTAECHWKSNSRVCEMRCEEFAKESCQYHVHCKWSPKKKSCVSSRRSCNSARPFECQSLPGCRWVAGSRECWAEDALARVNCDQNIRKSACKKASCRWWRKRKECVNLA